MSAQDSSPSRRSVGERGERLAAAHLRDDGWEIRETNFETPRGEIDIVAETTDHIGDTEVPVVAFVEVKTVSTSGAVPPEASVTASKRDTLTYMGRLYINKRELKGVSCRFDVMTVDLDGDSPDIEHYPAAFDAVGRWN